MIKVIAFDFFDTLVHRDCSPETVLYEWARQMSAFTKFCVSFEELYCQRKTIEKEISSSKREELSYKFLINKLYEVLAKRIPFIQKKDFLLEAFNTEVKTELNHLYVDKKNCALLKSYSETKKIVLISDFYCSDKFFKKILEHFNLLHYFFKIYVSSDIGKRKSTGSLYKYVVADLSISPNEMIMIGDNLKSDMTIPQNIGIQTKYVKYTKQCNLIKSKEIIKKIKQTRSRDLFSGYAPVILLFLNRLYKESVKNNVDTLLFCAREGQNLIYLFNEFQNKLYPQHIIKTKYFFVSRRATLLPSLTDIMKEDFNQIFRQYKELFIGDFLFSIGFSNKDIEEMYKKGSIKKEDLVTYKNNYEVIDKLRKNELFIKKYDSYRQESNKLFTKYLKKLIGNSKYITLVDVGWKGTIQDNIRKAVCQDYYIHGYYFGLNEDSQYDENNRKQGLVFDYTTSTQNKEIFSYNSIHLERVLAADHGPTVGYEFKNKDIFPILENSPKDIEIFEYVKNNQKQMNKTVIDLIDSLSHSNKDIEDFLYQITKYYLCFLMKDIPRNYNVFLGFRRKVKENFGNISNKKVEPEKSITIEKRIKKDFFYVDYTFRLLDKFHLRFLYPLATLYCEVACFLKGINIKR